MAFNTSINLGDKWMRFIQDLLDKGHYGSRSEVIRESLRLLEERELKLAALRAALIEGEESGSPKEFDKKEFLGNMNKKHG